MLHFNFNCVNQFVVGSRTFRVADLFVTKLTAKPVNARRREIGSRAFCVYRLPGKGLRRFFRVPKSLWFEIREIGSGTNHRGWTRTPEFGTETLGLSV
jgi:hypothetical protein